VIAKVRGWTRTEADLVSATGAPTANPPLRLAVMRWRDVAEGDGDALARSLGAFIEGEPDVEQARLFRSANGPAGAYWALIGFSTPRALGSLDWARLRPPSGSLDIANIYTRYWRREG
jgi:hypothetical protein